nr:MAG TPA: hypothetical protein [Caudoviricetes sp.]
MAQRITDIRRKPEYIGARERAIQISHTAEMQDKSAKIKRGQRRP